MILREQRLLVKKEKGKKDSGGVGSNTNANEVEPENDPMPIGKASTGGIEDEGMPLIEEENAEEDPVGKDVDTASLNPFAC